MSTLKCTYPKNSYKHKFLSIFSTSYQEFLQDLSRVWSYQVPNLKLECAMAGGIWAEWHASTALVASSCANKILYQLLLPMIHHNKVPPNPSAIPSPSIAASMACNCESVGENLRLLSTTQNCKRNCCHMQHVCDVVIGGQREHKWINAPSNHRCHCIAETWIALSATEEGMKIAGSGWQSSTSSIWTDYDLFWTSIYIQKTSSD